MAAMTMDREPEVARFIDTYKFDQEMSTRRDRFGGGTSLPLHSDGYEDKQRSLRDERHRDWLGQQEKQKQLEQQKIEARRRSPPRPAQPQGPQIDYNLAGQQAKAEEKRAYQDYMKAKEEQYWQMRGRPVTPPGGLNIGNYDRQLKETAAAKKKEYKEMLDQQKFEQQKLRAMDRVADLSPKYVSYRESERPLVGSPRDVNYYMQEKFEKDKFRKDLRNSPQRDFSPPGKNQVAEQSSMMEDANFKAFMEVEKDKAMNKRKYAEELLQQQKEHMYLRARQEPEMAVIDRNAPPQHLANKPPAGPGYNRSRDEAFKTNSYSRQPPPAPEQAFNGPPAFSNNGQRPIENGMDGFYERPVRTPGRPRSRRSVESERKYAPTNVDSGAQISPRRMKNTFYEDSQEVSSKRIEASKERQKDYNDFIRLKNEEKRRYEEEKHHQQISKPAEVVKNQYYSSDDYEKFQKEIQRKQGEEYRDFLAKKAGETRNRDWNFEQSGVLELHGDEAVQSKQRALRAERQKEYNSYISQQKVKHPDRRHEFVDTASGPYGGLFQGLGDHGNRSEALNKERQREYNEQHAGKEKISGRPNWARDTLPNNTDRGRSSPMKSQPPTDQYQQMLDEKRREEASRRRYDDPEYQGRLAESRERERGEAGPRYGGY